MEVILDKRWEPVRPQSAIEHGNCPISIFSNVEVDHLTLSFAGAMTVRAVERAKNNLLDSISSELHLY